MNESWTAGVRRVVLANGLRVLVQPDPDLPAVAVVTHVQAGFFDEPDHWVGISHVLEHMYFKGTARRGPGDIARETKAAGGYLNAGTSYDYTAYYTVLPAGQLAAALDIQADALQHSAIDAGELARELQVIIQEAKRKLDSPSAVAHETLHELLFDHHRIRRWRIGTEAMLAGFTRDDVAGYYRSRYVPARTILAVVGDVDAGEALALVERQYGAWPAEPGAVDRSPEEPPRREVRTRTLRGDVAASELVLGWRTVPPLHPDAPALDVAAGVLGAGRGSRLYRMLRQPGVATSVGAYHYAPTEVGTFTVGAEFEPPRLGAVLAGAAGAVRHLATDGPSADELERARALLLARWARRMESAEGRASALAAAEALGGLELLDREYAALRAVTAEQVREVAARYLAPDAVAGLVYHPDGRGDDLTPAALAEAMDATTAVPPAPAGGPVASSAVAVRDRAGHGVLHLPLPGADVLVRRKAGAPLVAAGLYVPRLPFDPPGQAGIGALALRAALRGAAGRDAAGLAYAIERLGGTLAPVATVDWLGLGTTVLAEHLDAALTLLVEAWDAPVLADAEIEAERALMLEEARQAADDMFRYPFQLAFRAAFGDAGYGLPSSGTVETLGRITPAAVRAHHAEFARRRLTVVVAGDVDPGAAAATAAARLAGRPPAEPLALAPDPAVRAAPGVRVVPRQKAQSALAMVFPGPAHRDPLRPAAELWAAVASGLGGRLFEALRDRRSLAYTVLASAWARARGGALLAYIATSPEREEEARGAMLEELARFATAPVAAADLDRARNYVIGQLEVGRQTAAAVAGEIVEAWLLDGGLDGLADPAAPYRRVTAADVQAVAAACLGAGAPAEGVVRGTGGGR